MSSVGPLINAKQINHDSSSWFLHPKAHHDWCLPAWHQTLQSSPCTPDNKDSYKQLNNNCLIKSGDIDKKKKHL